MRRRSSLAVCLAACATLVFTASVSAMYHPTLGRFAQRDPKGYADGMSLYQYVGSNAIRLVDPLGLAAWKLAPDEKWDRKTIEKAKQMIVAKVREHIDKVKKGEKKNVDCADVAITALIETAKELGLPLNFPVWDAKNRKWARIKSQDDKYTNAEQYADDVRANMGAVSLFDRDKVTRPKEIEKLTGGDLILYDLRYQRQAYTGHTRIVLDNKPDEKKIAVGEGHMTAVPEERTYSYEEVKASWNGPVGGKGREWNFDEIGHN